MSLQKALKLFSAAALAAAMLQTAVSAASVKPYKSHKNSEMKIALTFDDGPHKTYTPEILDILDEYEIKATFFVVGDCCEKYPEIVQRAIDSGHEIGNHTYSHPKMYNRTTDVLISEIIKTENVLFELGNTGQSCFVRPRAFIPRPCQGSLTGLTISPYSGPWIQPTGNVLR